MILYIKKYVQYSSLTRYIVYPGYSIYYYYIIMYTKFLITEIDDFQGIVSGFIDLMEKLSTQVEYEKLKVKFLFFYVVYFFFKKSLLAKDCLLHSPLP